MMASLPEPTWEPTWAPFVRDLAAALHGTRDPLTFVLGAGASLSSGAPSTGEVETALSSSATRIPVGELRRRLHEISDLDKRRALATIFDQLSPHIGYRCLAALARTRRILVINLNWDPLPTMACDLLGVDWVAYDIDEREHWGDSAALPPGRGLIDVHVHGRTAGKPRFGVAETAGFQADELDHLKSLHGSARRVYLGISLDDDQDVVDLLGGLDDGQTGTVWPFFRGAKIVDATEVARTLAKLGAKSPAFCQGEDVDFDHIMLALLDGVSTMGWEKVRREHSNIRLPALPRLVLPKPDLLRPALDAEVAVFVGDPQLGKTTSAWLLGWLRLLWAPSAGSLHGFDGAPAAKASIAVGSGADPADAFVIENPFGEAPDHSPNPGFVTDLARWAATPSVPRAVVTMRTADWEAAAGRFGAAGLYVASPVPKDWYDLEDLRRFAERSSPAGTKLAAEVAPEALDTPGRIVDRAGGLTVTTIGAGPGRVEAVERERRRLLEENQRLAALCCAVRLQSFASEPVDVDVLRALARFGGTTAGAALMVNWYELDDRPRVRLALPVDTAATDQWMIDRPADVQALLADPACPDSLREAWKTWSLLSAARNGRWVTVRGTEPRVIADNAGQILAASPSAAGMEVVSFAPLDAWAAADTAYSLVHLWGDLPPSRRQLLDRIVGNTDVLGTYAVLEACLYLQGSAASGIWDTVRDNLQRLSEGGSIWEIALAADGFAWRPPPGDDWSRGWTHQQLDRDTVLSGILPVLAAYHPGGADALRLGDRIKSGRYAPQTPEQSALAARLVAWHFVHQSRARAQLGHQRIVVKSYLCRTLHPPVGDTDDEGIMWLLSVLRAGGEPGWAFHAACFLMGALDRPLGPRCRASALEALSTASDGDLGVVTAAATYEVAADAEFGEAARLHFKGEKSRDLLLDALAQGVVIERRLIGPPGFLFAERPGRVVRAFGVRFQLVEEFFEGRTELPHLAPRVRAATRKGVRSGRLSPEAGARLVHLVEHGDFRPLEDALVASGAGRIDLDSLVEHAGHVVDRFGDP